MSGLSCGFTRRPTGAFWQERHRRRCLSRMTAGAGGLIAQFWRSEILSVASKPAELGGSRETEAHPTHDCATFAALGNHVPSTAPSLAVVIAAPRCVFHIVPVAGPGAVSQRRFGVDRQLLVDAVNGRFEEDGAVLQEGVVDAPTSARQAIEIVEVKLSSHGHDNTGVSSQLGSSPGADGPERGRKLRRQKTKGAKKVWWFAYG